MLLLFLFCIITNACGIIWPQTIFSFIVSVLDCFFRYPVLILCGQVDHQGDLLSLAVVNLGLLVLILIPHEPAQLMQAPEQLARFLTRHNEIHLFYHQTRSTVLPVGTPTWRTLNPHSKVSRDCILKMRGCTIRYCWPANSDAVCKFGKICCFCVLKL